MSLDWKFLFQVAVIVITNVIAIVAAFGTRRRSEGEKSAEERAFRSSTQDALAGLRADVGRVASEIGETKITLAEITAKLAALDAAELDSRLRSTENKVAAVAAHVNGKPRRKA